MPRTRRPMGTLEDHIMEFLWALESPASGPDVHSAVAPELAYTTVTTVLTRLVEKGRLQRERDGRSFCYSPVRSEADFRATRMSETLGASGDRVAVLSSFVDALATDDVETLRRLLDDEI